MAGTSRNTTCRPCSIAGRRHANPEKPKFGPQRLATGGGRSDGAVWAAADQRRAQDARAVERFGDTISSAPWNGAVTSAQERYRSPPGKPRECHPPILNPPPPPPP